MITAEDKLSYLALLRSGRDAATAARLVNQEYTASMFRRLTNEASASYDADFAAEYLRARAEGGREKHKNEDAAGKPRTTTLAGHVKAVYLTSEMLEAFLEDVQNGVPLTEACDKLEPKTSLTQISRRANRDPEFAEQYADAKQQGYPIFQERLREEAIRQARAGDYRALRDLLLIHVPEYRALLTQRHEISGPAGDAIRLLAQRALPDLPDEMLNQLIAHAEQKQIGNGETA